MRLYLTAKKVFERSDNYDTGDGFEKGRTSLGEFRLGTQFAIYCVGYCLNALFPEFIFWIPEPTVRYMRVAHQPQGLITSQRPTAWPKRVVTRR